jgi:hypothetical protein
MFIRKRRKTKTKLVPRATMTGIQAEIEKKCSICKSFSSGAIKNLKPTHVALERGIEIARICPSCESQFVNTETLPKLRIVLMLFRSSCRRSKQPMLSVNETHCDGCNNLDYCIFHYNDADIDEIARICNSCEIVVNMRAGMFTVSTKL